MSDTHILVINSGSSSLRFRVYDMRNDQEIAVGHRVVRSGKRFLAPTRMGAAPCAPASVPTRLAMCPTSTTSSSRSGAFTRVTHRSSSGPLHRTGQPLQCEALRRQVEIICPRAAHLPSIVMTSSALPGLSTELAPEVTNSAFLPTTTG